MSVIFFDVAELANVAEFLTGISYNNHEVVRVQICEVLAAYSKANARAYNRSYVPRCTKIKVVACTAKEIATKAQRSNVDQDRATGSLQLFGYNAVAQDGTDCLRGKAREDMSHLERRAFRWATDQIDRLREENKTLAATLLRQAESKFLHHVHVG